MPELEQGEGEPDVIVRFGRVPQTIEHATTRMVRFEAAPGRFLFRVDGIACYYVQEGREIVVEPYENSNGKDVRLFLLEPVFAALLYQRKNLVLHGAAVALNGNGIVLSGISGYGKSTLAAKFYQKGYAILTDDVCPVTALKDTPRITPGFPALRLWKDALKKLGCNVDNMARARDNLDKYTLHVGDRFQREPLPLAGIYILVVQNNADISITRLEGIGKMTTLMNIAYHLGFLQEEGGKTNHFEQCTAIANTVGIYRLSQPRDRFCAEQLVSLIEEELSGR
ncbi:MAG: hypothetical protein M0Z41_21260 [Peptococcaceae bacterium]|nr:hypothetical protein [Peptococcaceae bacterium]